jgi:hypothetical protein
LGTVWWTQRSETHPPTFYGGCVILFALVTTWITIPVRERQRPEAHGHTKGQVSAFLKVEAIMAIYILCILIYVYAFREYVNLQPILPILLVVVTFAVRKSMLSITDVFPIETAMFLAGFWAENTEDMISVLVFPQVRVFSFLSFSLPFFSSSFLLLMSYCSCTPLLLTHSHFCLQSLSTGQRGVLVRRAVARRHRQQRCTSLFSHAQVVRLSHLGEGVPQTPVYRQAPAERHRNAR